MAISRLLIIHLSTSAVGIFICLLASVTPGWIFSHLERSSYGIFYMCFYTSGRCSAKSYFDMPKDTDVLIHFVLIDAHVVGGLAIVLGVVGWLNLLLYAISKLQTPSTFVTSGIILLVASTFEFVLLVKFVVFNISIFKEARNIATLKFPYPIIISISGLFLILLTVVRIFIRYKQRENSPSTTTNHCTVQAQVPVHSCRFD